MGRDVCVAVAGATGAVGKEVVSVLDAAPWRPERLVAWCRAATQVPFVEYGDHQVPVDDLAAADLGAIDGLIVALPPDAAAPLVAAASEAGVPTVDCSGSLLADLTAPLVVPWLDPTWHERARARDVVSVPSAAGTLLASVLGPLRRDGWGGDASATVLLPASGWGREGIEELSKQVIALFNQGTPPRRVFEGGLAFDLLAQVGAAGATGWSAAELRAAAEVARLTGARCDVTVVGAPVFSGVSATVRLEGGDELAVERAERVLGELFPVRGASARRLPSPRRVDGKPFPELARLRRGMDGRSLHLWATMDNLHGAAVAAVGALAALLSVGDDA